MSVNLRGEDIPVSIKVNKNSLCKKLGISKDVLDKAYKLGGKQFGQQMASRLVQGRIQELKKERDDLNKQYSKDCTKTLRFDANKLIQDGNFTTPGSADFKELDDLIKKLKPEESVVATLNDTAKENLKNVQNSLKKEISLLIEYKNQISKRQQNEISKHPQKHIEENMQKLETGGLDSYQSIKILSETEKIYSRLPLFQKLKIKETDSQKSSYGYSMENRIKIIKQALVNNPPI